MQASLSRPAEIAPRAAASQLGVTLSFGGLSARATPAGSPSIKTTAILLAEADMMSSSADCPAGVPPRPSRRLWRRAGWVQVKLPGNHTGLFRSLAQTASRDLLRCT